jgi:amidase
MGELTRMSATALARAIRGREVSSREVVAAHLARIESVDGRLGAVVARRDEAALEEADAADAALARGGAAGDLHGVPITVKDNLEVEGLPCTAGTAGLRQNRPAADATVVARLRAAGAIVLGKTNLPELALAFETDNLVHGQTRNPYDPARTPGGSSGGEAAIIAAGGSPLGLGNDAGGSIRLPAHCCGVTGLKPTTGRVPSTGSVPPFVGPTGPLWQCGPLARRVEDLALALRLIAGPDGRDPSTVPASLGDPGAVAARGLRVALHVDNGVVTADVATAAAVRAAGRALADAGATVEEVVPPALTRAPELFVGLFCGDGGAGVQHVLEMLGTREPSQLVQRLGQIAAASALPTAAYAGMLVGLDVYRAEMLAFMARYDAILCPAAATPALPHDASLDHIPGFSYTFAYNLTGWPAAVVRAGTSPEGLPIGAQVVARPWREDVALALAGQVEAALGGWTAPPI